MNMINDDQLLIGLLSISDRAAQGVYADQGIPALEEWFGRALASPWRSERRLIVRRAGAHRRNIEGAG
jgi:molybdopterin adenylyltransferase